MTQHTEPAAHDGDFPPTAPEGASTDRERINELWYRGAQGLREQWDATTRQLTAIHHDVRIIGDMVVALANRLQALEAARASDYTRAREAWNQTAP